MGVACPLTGPGSQGPYGAGGQGCDAVLAALSSAVDVGPGFELDISAGQPGQLGSPEPGFDRHLQQRAVSSPGLGAQIRCGQDGFDLVVGEVGDDGVVTKFGGNGQDSLDVFGVFGMTQSCEPEQ